MTAIDIVSESLLTVNAVLELPFVPADFEPIDHDALRAAMTSPDIITDYLYPRDKHGKTIMERKMDECSKPPKKEMYFDDDLSVGDDGVYDFERPFDLDSDLQLNLDEDLKFDDDFEI